MAIHYFHCTDGFDLILDKKGRDTEAFGDAIVAASEVAAEIMQAVPAYRDWDNWAVHIYDEAGPLEVVPFGRRPRSTAAVTLQKTQSSKAGSTEPAQSPR